MLLAKILLAATVASRVCETLFDLENKPMEHKDIVVWIVVERLHERSELLSFENTYQKRR